MTFKPNKRLVWICGFSIALVLFLMAAGAFVLPAYVQSRVIPRLAAGFGLESEDVHVRRLGLWGADLGPIRLKARNAPVLTLAAVQIDYTPWSLLHGRIEGITLGGVGLTVAVTADGLSIGGYQLPARNSSAPKTGALPDLETLLPIQLTHFSLSESLVDVDWNGRRYVIPLDIRLETAGLDRGVLQGRAELSILGNSVRVAATLDQHANSASLKIQCDRFLLETLSQIGAVPAELKATGALGLNGRATVQLKPLAITGLDITGRLTEARVATDHGALTSMVTARGDGLPMDLSVSAQAPDRIQFACGPLQLDSPVKTAVTTAKGTLVRSDPGWSLNARVETLVPGQTLDSGLTWEKELPMNWQIEAVQGAENTVDFKVGASGSQPLAVGLEPFRLTGEDYQVDVKGHVADRRIEAQAMLAAGGLHVTFPDGAVTIPGAKISSTMAMAASPLPSKMTARAVISNIRSQVRSAVATLPEIQIDAQGQSDQSSPWAFQARLKIADGRMQDKTHGVALQGLDVDLPLQWPPVAKARAGRLGLQALQWKGRQLGGAKGILQQDARNLEVRLEHRSKLFAGLIVLIKSRLNAEGIHADIDIPSYQPAQAVDLGRFFPAAAGILADGRIESHGAVTVVDGETRGRFDLKVDQGTVDQVDRQVRLEGITLAFQINDIAALKSAPRQKLQVEKLQFGNLAAQKLDVDFQLEDHQTLFLEKVGLQWCQGRINAAALRIVPGKQDYDVTLFCDRLNLAMVLEQLGAAEAGGEGTVNGRIPVRWVNGRLSFDNGFLYSTPGQPGQIQLQGTEALLAGMPPGSPQHTQLDIATEALKDYTYQWAKLSVQSQKDVLLLKLQLDGKPNRLLPFAYDQQLGQFKRITGEGQAEFKGISIDLNFKSPLNEIIHYKEFLNRK